MRNKVNNVRGLDDALKLQMRVIALQQGLTLGEAMNQAIAAWIVREIQEGRAKIELTDTESRIER